MANERMQGRLAAFQRWKRRQMQTMEQLQPWLKQQGLATEDAQRSIESSLEILANNRFTIAVVGEFSRGKTELINALFFSDYGRRLLPTDAGRTTMCPTEIFQDNDEQPYLRLLPIETRLTDRTLTELRNDPSQWVHIPLNLNDPEELRERMQEMAASREVPMTEAVKLGMCKAELGEAELERDPIMEVPKWRLGLINFRHTLLAQGLTILDTPGLNAVGAEPELTYELLPTAQATLFVLSADTGVTRSDLEMWQQFIQGPRNRNPRGLMVVLNKTDTLWDELRQGQSIDRTIDSQVKETARILGVDVDRVFPASAQKGLVARIRDDRALAARSGMDQLETYLARDMVQNRLQLIMEESSAKVCDALDTLISIVAARGKRSRSQITGLRELSEKSEAAIQHMIAETSRDKQRYSRSITAFKGQRDSFQRHGRQLLDQLSVEKLDDTIERARKSMLGAWSTKGLTSGMRILFEEMNERMRSASEQTQNMRRLVRSVYRRFENDHGFELVPPPMYSIVKHQVALDLLHQEAEIFRKSPRTTLTEQHFVVRRYFRTIIRRARAVFKIARKEALQWLTGALSPVSVQVREHRELLTQQLNDLKNASQSRKTIAGRIRALERETRRHDGQLTSLRNVRQALGNTDMSAPTKRPKPYLVKNTA